MLCSRWCAVRWHLVWLPKCSVLVSDYRSFFQLTSESPTCLLANCGPDVEFCDSHFATLSWSCSWWSTRPTHCTTLSNLRHAWNSFFMSLLVTFLTRLLANLLSSWGWPTLDCSKYIVYIHVNVHTGEFKNIINMTRDLALVRETNQRLYVKGNGIPTNHLPPVSVLLCETKTIIPH